MQAITGCKTTLTTLTTKTDALQMDFGLIRRDMETFRGRLTETEHTAELHTLHTNVKSLKFRTEDAKNCNRRNNLRIIGVPEGAEGQDPAAFAEHLLQAMLPQAQFSHFFMVERAHRMLSTRSPVGSQPRTFYLAAPAL